jgi:hypothetical protein
MSLDLERRLLVQLFFDWLAERTAGALTPELSEDPRSAAARISGELLLVAVESVASGEQAEEWRSRVDELAEIAAGEAEPGVLIWLPQGAEPPGDEPARALVVDAVQSTLAGLAPGEMADAKVPVSVTITKRDEQGGYVSAYGGLSQHWARFTDRVRGYHQIKSSAIHRLPDEEALDSLVARVVEASAGLSVGQSATVETMDSWRVQRLQRGTGAAVIAAPPDDESETGAPLRRHLRSVIRLTGEALGAVQADLRALLLYGHYPAIDDNPVGATLRGQDPALFAGLDLVVLAAEGQVRTLVDVTRRPSLRSRER